MSLFVHKCVPVGVCGWLCSSEVSVFISVALFLQLNDLPQTPFGWDLNVSTFSESILISSFHDLTKGLPQFYSALLRLETMLLLLVKSILKQSTCLTNRLFLLLPPFDTKA